MTSQDEPIAISDVANILKVAAKTLYGAARKGDLSGLKVGGR